MYRSHGNTQNEPLPHLSDMNRDKCTHRTINRLCNHMNRDNDNGAKEELRSHGPLLHRRQRLLILFLNIHEKKVKHIMSQSSSTDVNGIVLSKIAVRMKDILLELNAALQSDADNRGIDSAEHCSINVKRASGQSLQSESENDKCAANQKSSGSSPNAM